MFDDYQEITPETEADQTLPALPTMADLVELEADLNEIDNTLAELQDK